MSAELEEAAALSGQARAWMETLTAAGVGTRQVAAAVITALIERVLVEQGKPATVAWLLAQATLTDKIGDELLRALGKGT